MACHVIREPNDPTDAPPFSGMHFVNTASGALFESNGTATVANWISQTTGANESGRVNFFGDNVISNKYLKRENNHVSSSDVEPFICPFNLDITSLTFMNKVDSTTIDFEVERNASVIFTWSISVQRRRIKTNGLGSLQGVFLAGDKISVFAKAAGGTSPEDVLLDLGYLYTSTTLQEIGSATL